MKSVFKATLILAACVTPTVNRIAQSLVWYLGALSLIYAQHPLYAQEVKPWMVRAEFGQAEIHRAESDGQVFGFRVGRNLEHQGLVRLDLGISLSSADEDYLLLDSGLELTPTPRYWLTPFVGARFGLIAEPEYSGTVLQGGAGIDFNLGQSAGLRFAVYRGTHGGATGPHLILGGMKYRF